MIEKGLTMQPRRDKFATGYIIEVLERLEHSLRLGAVGDETVAWARDVLDGYFEATATSTSSVIARARAAYLQISLDSDTPYCGPALPVKPPIDFQPERLEMLARHRRSVRWYQNRSVDRAIVDRAVEIAVESPSACNRVPYQIRVFDAPADARRVAAIAGGTNGYVQNLQAVAVIVGDLSAYQDERDRHLIYIDGSLAAMGFVYALESSGVSSCCINWPDMKAPEIAMRKLIGLEPYERVVMLVAFGYSDPDGLAPASPKLSLEQVRTYRSLKAHE
jgi:nitroreductase